MTTTQIVTLVLGSSVLSGLVAAFTQLFVAGRALGHATTEREAQQRFNRTERMEQQGHAAALRQEQAHDAARSEFLPKAEAFARWVEHERLLEHIQQVGSYYPPKGRPPVLTSPGEALDTLADIASGHPTKTVRIAARAPYDRVAVSYGDVDSNDPGPDLNDWKKWDDSAQDLIEAIHSRG